MKKLADPDFSALRALDARTGEMKWEFRFQTSSLAGVMSTVSGLVFAGNQEGDFNAFDARSGKRLWSYRTGAPIWGAAAMTYMQWAAIRAHRVGQHDHGVRPAGEVTRGDTAAHPIGTARQRRSVRCRAV